MADPGEGSGGPAPPYFQSKLRPEGPKKYLWRLLPLFSVSGWLPPPPTPPLSYLKIWIRHWTITHSHHPSWSDPVWVPSIDLISIWRVMFHSKLQKLLLYSYWILWKSHGLFQKFFLNKDICSKSLDCRERHTSVHLLSISLNGIF